MTPPWLTVSVPFVLIIIMVVTYQTVIPAPFFYHSNQTCQMLTPASLVAGTWTYMIQSKATELGLECVGKVWE